MMNALRLNRGFTPEQFIARTGLDLAAAAPSLARAQALGDRAARGGFDWRDLTEVMETADGPLPPPAGDYMQRFGGLANARPKRRAGA